MALRSGYKGIKKLAAGLKWNRPGILAADDTALAKVFFPRSEQSVLGAVNLFDISKAVNGNLKVVNNTLENLATDTRSANFWVGIRKGTTPVQTLLTLQNLPSVGHYEFSFTIPNNVDYDNLYIGHNGANTDVKCSYPFNRFGTFYISFDAMGVDVSTVGGYILTNVQIALSANAPYAPYAMTNKELTDAKVGKAKTSTETKATIFSESSKVSSCTAILNDILCALRITSTAQASVSGAWTTIATLNEAYRPANLVYETAIDDAGNPFGWVRIHADGKVEVYQGSGSAKTVNISSLYLRS